MVLLDILIFMWVVKGLATAASDVSYAVRGQVSPRITAKLAARQAAGGSRRYGPGDYLRDLWHDSWEDARTTRERKRAKRDLERAGVFEPYPDDDTPDPWDHAKPTEPAAPTVEPVTAPPATPAPRKPSPKPNTSTGGSVAVEAANYEGAIAALAQTIQQLTVVQHQIEWAGTEITAANNSVEAVDEARAPLHDDVVSLKEQLTAKGVPMAASLETVVAAISPDKVQELQDALAAVDALVAAMHAAVVEAHDAAAKIQAEIAAKLGDAADTVAATGIDPTFLAAT